MQDPSPTDDWSGVKKVLTNLCINLDITEVLAHLLQEDVLRELQIERIETAQTRYQQNFDLLRMLMRCEKGTLEKFHSILLKTGQQHLVKNSEDYCNKRSLSLSDGANSIFNSPDTMNSLTAKLINDVKSAYRQKLKEFNPLTSLETVFAFHIEQSWVQPTLQSDTVDESLLQQSDNHIGLIQDVFKLNKRLLIIEGRAASGKTSLLHKIAFDWSLEKLEMYSLVLLVEYCFLPEQFFTTIPQLVLRGSQEGRLIEEESCTDLKSFFDHHANRHHRCLILLDGYDESKLPRNCEELESHLNDFRSYLSYDVIITTRPGYFTYQKNETSRFTFTTITGFDTFEQKENYIQRHFRNQANMEENVQAVKKLLQKEVELNILAETPLYLVFICMVHNDLVSKTIFDLYYLISWRLIDRYQRSHPSVNVPELFGYIEKNASGLVNVIHRNWTDFPLVQRLGTMALEIYPTFHFTEEILKNNGINSPIILRTGMLLSDDFTMQRTIPYMKYYFPHRTLQEFLAGGLFYFWPDEKVNRNKFKSAILKREHNSQENVNSNSCSAQEDLQRPIEMGEIEKFIFRSIGSELLPRNPKDPLINQAVKEFLIGFESLELDISVLDCSPSRDHATILNECLRHCVNVFYLELRNEDAHRKDAQHPISLQHCMDFTTMKKLRILRISANKRIMISHADCALKFGAYNSLTKIELERLWFTAIAAFSEVFAVFQNALINCNTTLQLTDVTIELNSVNLVVKTDSQPIPRYYLIDKETSPFSQGYLNEFFRAVQHLTCAKELEIVATKEKSFLPVMIPLIGLPDLESLRFTQFSFYELQELERTYTGTFRRRSSLLSLQKITFAQCTFSNAKCVEALRARFKTYARGNLDFQFINCEPPSVFATNPRSGNIMTAAGPTN